MKRPDDGYNIAANLEFIKLDLLDIWRAIDRLEREWKCRQPKTKRRARGILRHD